jgi:hypothetical protein
LGSFWGGGVLAKIGMDFESQHRNYITQNLNMYDFKKNAIFQTSFGVRSDLDFSTH